MVGRDFKRGMRPRGRGAADEKGQGNALSLHFLGDVGHFFQRRRNQTGQSDGHSLVFNGGIDDGLCRHHHAKIDDFKIIAGEHNADDVLADIVDVSFDRGHDDAAIGAARVPGFLERFDVRQQERDRFLHHPRRFDDLRQEHLSGTEKITDRIHATHQMLLNDIQRM